MLYFYAVSRRDLPSHQQAIQSAHAQHEYLQAYPSMLSITGTPFVWLTVEDKEELIHLIKFLETSRIPVASFTDPDYNGYDPSAISFMVFEKERYLISDLPLWVAKDDRKKDPFSNLLRLIRSFTKPLRS